MRTSWRMTDREELPMDVRLVDAERAARLRKVAEGLMCNGGYADRIRGSGIMWTLAELDLLDDIENALTAGKQSQGTNN